MAVVRKLTSPKALVGLPRLNKKRYQQSSILRPQKYLTCNLNVTLNGYTSYYLRCSTASHRDSFPRQNSLLLRWPSWRREVLCLLCHMTYELCPQAPQTQTVLPQWKDRIALETETMGCGNTWFSITTYYVKVASAVVRACQPGRAQS